MEMVLPDASSFTKNRRDYGQPQRIKGFSLVMGDEDEIKPISIPEC
jgi:hypothetical protein